VRPNLAASRAKLAQLEPLGIISPVLCRRVRTLSAIGAGEVDDDSILFLGHQMSFDEGRSPE
jgi:hypothetical protein